MSRLRFSGREVRDLVLAWLALGVAFAIFFSGGGTGLMRRLAQGGLSSLGLTIVMSLLTAGVAFLLHELGHKVVAVRFGQIAEFRADYGMLFIAMVSALAGFLFAAPGAVHHRGQLTERQHGLIALAGPAVNVVLAVAFLPLLVLGAAQDSQLLGQIGLWGVVINLFLAAFNMVPYGPLDGRKVLGWSKVVWVAFTIPVGALALLAVGGLGF